MNKLRVILACLLAFLVVLAVGNFLNIKHKMDVYKKSGLPLKIRQALLPLMSDLRQAHENDIQDVPADGRWYDHIVLSQQQQGAVEYLIQEGRLWRISNGKRILIADDIGDWRLRRQKMTPDILEIRIHGQKPASFLLNLRTRVPQ